MEQQQVIYESGGRTFTGYLVDGSTQKTAPGILVAHEGGGLTDHAKQRARMLAKIGYVAFAMDIFGEPPPSLDRARQLVATLRADLPELRARGRAALDVLRGHPRIDSRRLAAIGFCFGGTAVLELARDGAELACTVGFHAGLDTTRPEDAPNIAGKVLVCLGADDPIVTAAQRAAFAAEMSSGGVDWQMHLYGGVGHSFTNRDIDSFGFAGFRYDARADARSWAAMRALFGETFGDSV
jgi:dienelactone hydrolase